MSVSEEGETLEGFDTEQICFGDLFLHPEYSARESFVSDEEVQARWKRIPRSPPDFSLSKSELSSCGDSTYEEWLENYYKDELKHANQYAFEEVGVDTSDLLVEERKNDNVRAEYQPKLGKWSYSTKYWGPNQVRRHWALEMKTGDVSFLPSIHPILNLRSRYGRFLSQLNSAAAVPEETYRKFICGAFKKVIERLEVLDPQLINLMLCDNLCNFKWFDSLSKATVTKTLCRLLRSQVLTTNVYLENTDLDRQEGIVFLCALSQNAGDSIEGLHIWKMFGYGQSPPLLNELTRKGELKPAKRQLKFLSKIHFLEILNNFSSLTSLSVNYSYLANQNGEVLLCLKCIRTGALKHLRILCLKDERPLVTNPGYGVGGWKIPDGVWRRIAQWNPNLEVHFVFLNMPQYENIILFLSKNIPVAHVYLSSGIDLEFQSPWDIDSTLLELRNWYSSTLQNLSLHLWHHRDLLDFVIRKKILEEFPNLINFEFIGVLQDVETLEEFCCQLSRGTYKLKTLLFWVQEQYTNETKRIQKTRRVAEIRTKYHRKFQVLEIDADIQTYAM